MSDAKTFELDDELENNVPTDNEILQQLMLPSEHWRFQSDQSLVDVNLRYHTIPALFSDKSRRATILAESKHARNAIEQILQNARIAIQQVIDDLPPRQSFLEIASLDPYWYKKADLDLLTAELEHTFKRHPPVDIPDFAKSVTESLTDGSGTSHELHAPCTERYPFESNDAHRLYCLAGSLTPQLFRRADVFQKVFATSRHPMAARYFLHTVLIVVCRKPDKSRSPWPIPAEVYDTLQNLVTGIVPAFNRESDSMPYLDASATYRVISKIYDISLEKHYMTSFCRESERAERRVAGRSRVIRLKMVDLMKVLQKHARREIKARTLLAVGHRLPIELTEVVAEFASDAEEVPDFVDMISKISSKKSRPAQ